MWYDCYVLEVNNRRWLLIACASIPQKKKLKWSIEEIVMVSLSTLNSLSSTQCYLLGRDFPKEKKKKEKDI